MSLWDNFFDVAKFLRRGFFTVIFINNRKDNKKKYNNISELTYIEELMKYFRYDCLVKEISSNYSS